MDISLGIGILVTSISLQASQLGSQQNDYKYKNATNAAIEASYKQTGLEQYVQTMEKKYTPQWIREHIGWGLVVTKVAVENRIAFKWEF